MARYHVLCDLIALASAGLLVTNKTDRSDGRCSDGLTMVPWKEGKPRWDCLPLNGLVHQCVSQDVGSAVELAALYKADKYSA